MRTIEATKYCILELQNRELKPFSRAVRFIGGQDFFHSVLKKNVKQTTLQKIARLGRNSTPFKSFFLGFALLAVALAPNVQAQVIRLISAPGKFYVDDKAGNGIVYNYAAYTISNNTASSFPSLYVALRT